MNQENPVAVLVSSVIQRPHHTHQVEVDGWVIYKSQRGYLNLVKNVWEVFPDWAIQFKTKEEAESKIPH